MIAVFSIFFHFFVNNLTVASDFNMIFNLRFENILMSSFKQYFLSHNDMERKELNARTGQAAEYANGFLKNFPLILQAEKQN